MTSCQATSKVEPSFIPLFDGKTLKGWRAADMSWWSVEEGTITARITANKPCNENGERNETEITSAQGEPHFDLRQWHEYHLICQGNRLTLNVDGKLVTEVIDHDPNELDLAGLLSVRRHSWQADLPATMEKTP
jgi:hypothetical protein